MDFFEYPNNAGIEIIVKLLNLNITEKSRSTKLILYQFINYPDLYKNSYLFLEYLCN